MYCYILLTTSLQTAIMITRPGWKQPIYATEQTHPSSHLLDQGCQILRMSNFTDTDLLILHKVKEEGFGGN